MAYVKKTATLFLFFIVIVSIIFVSVAVVFFQRSLSSLNDNLRNRENDIRDLNLELSSLNTNVSNLNKILDIQLLREENLSVQYLTLKIDNEDLNVKNIKLENDLEETKDDLSDAISKVTNQKFEISALQLENTNLTDTNEIIFEDINDICEDALSLNISICSRYD